MSESRSLDCRAAMMQLYDFLDGELSAERMTLIREHLECCKPCYEHAKFERDILAIIAGGWRDISASQDLRARIRAGLRDAGLQTD